jgi:hypothetical protein
MKYNVLEIQTHRCTDEVELFSWYIVGYQNILESLNLSRSWLSGNWETVSVEEVCMWTTACFACHVNYTAEDLWCSWASHIRFCLVCVCARARARACVYTSTHTHTYHSLSFTVGIWLYLITRGVQMVSCSFKMHSTEQRLFLWSTSAKRAS